MTRAEFLEGITEWDELLAFCEANGCDICDDLICGDEIDVYIESDISRALVEWPWESIRDALDEIDTGYDCYAEGDGMFDYTGLTGADFEDYKNVVYNWMSIHNAWDDDGSEVIVQHYTGWNIGSDDELFSEEDISIAELLGL